MESKPGPCGVGGQQDWDSIMKMGEVEAVEDDVVIDGEVVLCSPTPTLLHLPLVPLRHLLALLPHSSLLALACTCSSLHSLVMEEWRRSPSLWRHVTLPSSLSSTGLASLR